MFTRGDFHWKTTRAVGIGGLEEKQAQKKIKDAINILNNLNAKQQEAVRLYGNSRHEDGIDDGVELHYHDD